MQLFHNSIDLKSVGEQCPLIAYTLVAEFSRSGNYSFESLIGMNDFVDFLDLTLYKIDREFN